MPNKTKTFKLALYAPGEEDHPVYAIGNFNQWRLADERFQMQSFGDGHYELVISADNLPKTLEYKYARGNWDHVELLADGSERPNRKVARSLGSVQDKVLRWKQANYAFDPKLLPIIEVIEQDFEMPAGVRTRRIAALLPYNYHETDRHYPVLYLQDGQNLFDDYAPYGNWAVDKRLAQLQATGHGDVIIIAIDHAMDKRIVEYTPTAAQTRFGKGEGSTYVHFLTERLKPYVDQHYRTLSDHDNTGIGGSSMGGLISVHAGLMYPQVYGKLMIFSPSLWVTPNPDQLINRGAPYQGQVYLYGGEAESDTMVPNMKRLQQALLNQDAGSDPEFYFSVDPAGKHTETRWGEEFPKALRWLYFNAN